MAWSVCEKCLGHRRRIERVGPAQEPHVVPCEACEGDGVVGVVPAEDLAFVHYLISVAARENRIPTRDEWKAARSIL